MTDHRTYLENCRANTAKATAELETNNTDKNLAALELCYQEEEDAAYSLNELLGNEKEKSTFTRTQEHKRRNYNYTRNKNLTLAEYQTFYTSRPRRRRD